MRSWLTLPRLAVALVFLGIFAMAARPSVDTDTWWHLRAGAWMLEHGQVLTRDVFSSTRYGTFWLNVNWLSQIGLALVWRAGGFAGLNMLTAALVTVAFIFVYLQCEGNAYLRAFTLVLAAAASAVFWSARPQLASFGLASVFAYVLHAYRRPGRNYLWTLPPLMLLWANLHGGFAIGFLLLGATLAGEAAGRMLFPAQTDGLGWRGLGALALTTAACGAAVAVNPFGLRLYGIPFQTVSIGVLQDYIQEWQSPNFHLPAAQVFIWLQLATFGAVGLGRRRLDLTDLLLFGGFTFLALLAGRNISIVALLAPPIITRHTAAALAELRARRPRLAAVLDPSPAPNRLPLVNWALLSVVALAVLVKVADAALPKANDQLLRRQSPVDAVAYLQREQPPGPLFNSYNWGGYLLWALYPQYPVFVDGRTDLYENDLLSAYLTTAAGRAGYAELLDERGINLVLIETESALTARLAQSGAWRVLYADDMATVYQRDRLMGTP
ncbi:MAG: hypothetical protein IT317_07800 [Anaerolineales bacterium]|nr:hypothetical protein [Anaerolineales bacterium]